jgi:hydrogenase nickel incorporation protein HypA/HybF
MHELGLCDAVVEAVLRRAQGRPVSWARVRIGGHAVDPAVITQGVQMAAAATLAERMRLEIVAVPARAVCGACGADEPVTDALSLVACGRCGSIEVEVQGDEDAVLEAIGYRASEGETDDTEGNGWTQSSC